MSRVARVAIAATVAVLAMAPAARAQLPGLPTVPGAPPLPPLPGGLSGTDTPVEPYGAHDGGGFRDILPPGTRGRYNAAAARRLPRHRRDRPALLRPARHVRRPRVRDARADSRARSPTTSRTRRSACPPDEAERIYSPRADVTIVRDKGFGVPHVYGKTRDGAMFGLGYAAAEDRLFFMDVLRHAGRGELSSFAGGSNAGDGRGAVGRSRPTPRPTSSARPTSLPEFLGAQGTQISARRRQLHRRHQPVHLRGEARPDEDAGRVRRDRPPAGAGPVEARRT